MSLKARIRQIVYKLLPPHVIFDQNRNDVSGALFRAWGHVVTSHMLFGAYYEFGVYKGNSLRECFRIYSECFRAWMLGQAKSTERWRREVNWECNHHFYAFDTFEGMPDNSEHENLLGRGSFDTSLSQVRADGEKVGMCEGDQVRYFKGLFSDIAISSADEVETLLPAVIVNIDCDLYESTVDALALIRPKLQQGTVLLMDDWNIFCADRNRGERRALREFLENNLEIEAEPYFAYGRWSGFYSPS